MGDGFSRIILSSLSLVLTIGSDSYNPLYIATIVRTCIKWTFLFSFFQGQKGEAGSPAKPPQGAIKFGDTAEKCTLRNAGTVRYSATQNALQLCDGSAWLPLVTGGKGQVASRPGHHCLDILNSGEFEMKLKK